MLDPANARVSLDVGLLFILVFLALCSFGECAPSRCMKMCESSQEEVEVQEVEEMKST